MDRKYFRQNLKGEKERMRNRVLTLISVGALIIGAVIFAAAQDGPRGGGRPGQQQGGPPHPPPPPPPFGVPDIEHLTTVLGLTDAQAAELKPFLDSERTTIDTLAKKMGDLHRQLEEATAQGRFDEAQVRGLASQMGQTQADLIVEQERVKAKIYSTLTPEQRAKADELHKRGGPRGRGPGRPGEPPPPPPPPSDN